MFQNISNSIYFSFHFYPCSFYSHTQPLCVSLKGYSTLLFKWTKIFEWKKDVLKKAQSYQSQIIITFFSERQ